jgi:hypothetical protein
MDNVRRVNIAIASPRDVADERAAVLRVFNSWNGANSHAFLHPIMWEARSVAVPELGDHPQHILNKSIIDPSDLLIGILWSRLGTPTPTARSGTDEEIREFIAQKGAARVMLYFCKRPVPHDIDAAELARVQSFEKEMKLQGIVHEYETVQQFEGDLYVHLDVKVRDLLAGKLSLPMQPKKEQLDKPGGARQHADPRLRALVDFGTTLEEISAGFAARMNEFDAVEMGKDKYFDLGAHVYTSVAECLDRYVAQAGAQVTEANRSTVERLSTRLKELAGRANAYLKNVPQFWIDGREISNALAAHVGHVHRTLGK